MAKIDSMVPKGTLFADRYEIQFPSGSNGLFKSFRAKDRDGTLVRLELTELATLPDSHFDSNGHLRQIALLESLKHPNIPEVIDHGEVVVRSSRVTYLCFKMISGESLTELLGRSGRLSAYKVLPMALELLETLDYLHNLESPVIYNGVSPDSIILDYAENRDRPILTGFDHARDIHASRDSISLKGMSLFHAAPELMHGLFVPQSDLFSVGALIYHLVLGNPPWFDESVFTVESAKVRQELAKLRSSSLRLDFVDESVLDDQFKETLKTALSVDVEKRFQTAQEFAQALRRELAFEGKSSSQSTFVSQDVRTRVKEPGTGFDGIAGMAELKTILNNEVIRPIVEHERFAKFGIPLLNGALLYGPPGCGKTFVAERLVEEIGFNFIKVNPSDLASPFVHGGQEKIGQLFKSAAEMAPCLLFIDEFDALVPSREGDVSHHYAAEVNEMLAQMSSCGKRGIFVIGATNRPEKIDSAILRTGRFDKLIYLPQPDAAAREAMFRLHLEKCPSDLGIDHARLADLTENYVSSDIAMLVVDAARKAELEDTRVTMKMLEEAISENGPSVSRKELKKYEELNKKWLDERKGMESHRSIGFINPDED